MSSDRFIDMTGGNYNERIEGNYIQGNYYAAEPKPTLATAAVEIQELLQQLEHSYPPRNTSDRMILAKKVVKRVEEISGWKQRVINAVREGGLAAFEKAIDNPTSAFIVGLIKGWKEIEVEQIPH